MKINIFSKRIFALASTCLLVVGIGASTAACSQENNVTGLSRAIVSYFATPDVYGLPTSEIEMDFNSNVKTQPDTPYSFANWEGNYLTQNNHWAQETWKAQLESKMTDTINMTFQQHGITKNWISKLSLTPEKSNKDYSSTAPTSVDNTIFNKVDNNNLVKIDKFGINMLDNNKKKLEKIYMSVDITKATKWSNSDSILNDVLIKGIKNKSDHSVALPSGEAVTPKNIQNFIQAEINNKIKKMGVNNCLTITVNPILSDLKTLSVNYSETLKNGDTVYKTITQKNVLSVSILNKFKAGK